MPMPRLSEKKAWPSAFTTTPGVIFEKSGAKKKRRPSPAFGSDNDTQQNTTRSRNSMGISTFDSRSMPLRTPNSSTPRLSRMSTYVLTSGPVLPQMYSCMRALNTPSSADASASVVTPAKRLPLKLCRKYSSVQPATTI